jgi:hypothetical protein
MYSLLLYTHAQQYAKPRDLQHDYTEKPRTCKFFYHNLKNWA